MDSGYQPLPGGEIQCMYQWAEINAKLTRRYMLAFPATTIRTGTISNILLGPSDIVGALNGITSTVGQPLCSGR